MYNEKLKNARYLNTIKSKFFTKYVYFLQIFAKVTLKIQIQIIERLLKF